MRTPDPCYGEFIGETINDSIIRDSNLLYNKQMFKNIKSVHLPKQKRENKDNTIESNSKVDSVANNGKDNAIDVEKMDTKRIKIIVMFIMLRQPMTK